MDKLNAQQVVLLQLDQIDASEKPWHSRGVPECDDVEAFAAMLMANTGRIQHPLKVRPHPTTADMFELITGKIRYYGAERAGIAEVPVIVEVLSDVEASLVSLGENVGRRGLPYLQIGWRAVPLIAAGYQQSILAVKVGCNAPQLSEALKFAIAIPEAKAEAIAQRHGRRAQDFTKLSREDLRRIKRLGTWEEREHELEQACRAMVEEATTSSAEGAVAGVSRSAPAISLKGDDLRVVVPNIGTYGLFPLIQVCFSILRAVWIARASSRSSR